MCRLDMRPPLLHVRHERRGRASSLVAGICEEVAEVRDEGGNEESPRRSEELVRGRARGGFVGSCRWLDDGVFALVLAVAVLLLLLFHLCLLDGCCSCAAAVGVADAALTLVIAQGSVTVHIVPRLGAREDHHGMASIEQALSSLAICWAGSEHRTPTPDTARLAFLEIERGARR